jgi:hypothetical protein
VSNLPEPIRPLRRPIHPALYRAAVSPTAVVVTGAGAGIGLLAHSIVLTVVLAVAGWTGRMAAAVGFRRRRERAARPRPAEIDPWSVPEPWRQLLQQAASAQSRFDQAVAGWPPGPTHDRLTSLQPRIYAEVGQLGVLARQGAAATGWSGAAFSSGRPSGDQLARELAQVQAERARLGSAPTGRQAELDRREEAIAAQLRAVRRAGEAGAELQDRLRMSVARLDETVTELLTVESQDTDPAGVASALDELSDGIVSLRAALTETTGVPGEPGAAPPDTRKP